MIKNNKPQPSIPQTRDPVIPVHQRKTVGTLNANDCRWPIGDPQRPDFHFCGKPKAIDFPYCEVHARRSFVPARPRSERPYIPHKAA